MLVRTQDIVWHVRIDGDSSMPPLVMLHGFAQSLYSFTLQVPELSSRFRVIRLDLPGHGGTAAPAMLDWKRLCETLHEVIAKFEWRPAHWFGYSQGGRVALMAALAKPDLVKSLSLLGASPGIADENQRELRTQSDRLLGQNIVGRGMEWFAEYWESLPIFATQKYLPDFTRKLIRTERTSCSPQGLKFALDHYGTGTMPDCFGKLSNWNKPLMLVAGELDRKFIESNRRIADATRAALLMHYILPKCGHAAHLEQPEEFTRLLIDFIQEAESKTA